MGAVSCKMSQYFAFYSILQKRESGQARDVIQKQFNGVIIDIALISHQKHVCIF
jgi:hypothetical protein